MSSGVIVPSLWRRFHPVHVLVVFLVGRVRPALAQQLMHVLRITARNQKRVRPCIGRTPETRAGSRPERHPSPCRRPG
jgi:hypothetical protein